MTETPIPDCRTMTASEFREAKRAAAHTEILEAGRRAEAEALARLEAQHAARFRNAQLPPTDMIRELTKRGMTEPAAADLVAEIAAARTKGKPR